MQIVDTAPHEFDVQLNFVDAGLDPYFAADRIVKDHGGAHTVRFDVDGETFEATLSYTADTGIRHPGDTLPSGRPFHLETIREFELRVEAVDDPAGQRSFYGRIRPRWDGMTAQKSDGSIVDIPVPPDMDEATNLRVQGSNIEFDRYLPLIQQAAAALGIRPDYFADPHDTSTVTDAARYVRLDRDRSGPIHARDGPIASMGHLLENDRDGYRKVVQNDRDDHGNTLEGYYHTATLGPQRVREAFPDHSLPREVKHYYAREAASKSPDDPLAHPKLEVAYQVSRWDDSLGVEADDLDRLTRECEETIAAVMADAGLDPSPGGRAFVEDDYFDPDATGADREIVDLDFTRIRQNQESVVIEHIADGLSPVEWDSLEVLVTDGGQVAPADIAEEKGRHLDSVYDALGSLGDLVDREYGSVSLRSHHVADLVHEAIQQARDSTRRAIDAAGKAVEAAERGRENMSAFVAWAASHNVDWYEDSNGDLQIGLGTIEADTTDDAMREIRRRLREGLEVWTDAGFDPTRLRAGQWSATIETPEFEDLQSDLDLGTVREVHRGGVGGTLR